MVTGTKRAFSVFDFRGKIDLEALCRWLPKPKSRARFSKRNYEAHCSCPEITEIPKVAGISIHTLFVRRTTEARSRLPHVRAGSGAGRTGGYEDGITIGGGGADRATLRQARFKNTSQLVKSMHFGSVQFAGHLPAFLKTTRWSKDINCPGRTSPNRARSPTLGFNKWSNGK